MANRETAKTKLRDEIRARLKTITPGQRASDSAKACSLLEAQPVWKTAQSILFFAPLPNELDLWPLLCDSVAAGKTVSLPRFDAKSKRYLACQVQNADGDIVSGQFGIREPKAQCTVLDLNRLDLVLVPGVAFDLRGGRLGRGKGFYDQLLSLVQGTTCGVAFDEQLVGTVPVEPHDVHLNCILTPTRWLGFKL
jgi:5-formyltetrahydrofolate cyclo-ligase